MGTSSTRVAVLGAGGHTGRFIVDLLQRKGAVALPATRSGTFTGRGGDPIVCPAIDFAQASSLDRALAEADAVINCAGPFFDTAEPGAEAAVRRGIPYVDVMAEQITALRLFEHLNAKARTAGVIILPAMAFYGGLADLLVSALVPPRGPIDHVEIAVGLDSWAPTRGTRLTGARNSFARMVVRDGRLVPIPPDMAPCSWVFPAPWGTEPVACVPLAEIILLSRHIKAQSITSYMNLKPLEDLADPHTPPPRASEPDGRSAQRFVIDVRVTAPGGGGRALATGRDIYAATAPLAVQACLDLLARGPGHGGVFAPGALFEPQSFFAGLAPDIEVSVAPNPPPGID